MFLEWKKKKDFTQFLGGEDFLIFIFQFYNERIMDFSFQE
jgi:hypothetical protein